MEKFEQQEQERWNALADTILELDPPQNKNMGGETVTESIASALRRGDVDHAKACCFSESDKFSSPKRKEVKNLLIAELFDGKDHP